MKNTQLATSFYVKASECFTKKQYIEALENYNQTLRFATNNTQLLSDSFAGKAEIYFETKHYQFCDDNIQRAIVVCVDDEKCESFKEIQAKCIKSLKEINFEDKDDECPLKLSHAPNKKVPFIADCLEVLENKIYGRYISTTKDLKPGDVVVLEEPFYKVLDPEQRHTRCAICLKQNSLNLFPCGKCSKAMFCSKMCSDSVVHHYECVAPKEESFEKLLLQRMFYQAIEISGSLEELQKLMARQDSSKTIMDFDLSDTTDPMNAKNRILATTSLAEREPWSAEAYAKYESVTQQLEAKTDDERDFLRNYLVRCLKSMTVNFFHFFWSPDQPVGQGFALCSLAAYFAHSCDPNVEKIDVDNKFMFVAKKPINAGEQLFMNYDRFSFLTHSLEDRQEYFSKIYTFDCGCKACSNNYPELLKLQRFDKSFTVPKTTFSSKKSAMDQYKKNCVYIEENIENYPCFEVCTLMIQNYRLLHYIGNEIIL